MVETQGESDVERRSRGDKMAKWYTLVGETEKKKKMYRGETVKTQWLSGRS